MPVSGERSDLDIRGGGVVAVDTDTLRAAAARFDAVRMRLDETRGRTASVRVTLAAEGVAEAEGLAWALYAGLGDAIDRADRIAHSLRESAAIYELVELRVAAHAALAVRDFAEVGRLGARRAELEAEYPNAGFSAEHALFERAIMWPSELVRQSTELGLWAGDELGPKAAVYGGAALGSGAVALALITGGVGLGRVARRLDGPVPAVTVAPVGAAPSASPHARVLAPDAPGAAAGFGRTGSYAPVADGMRALASESRGGATGLGRWHSHTPEAPSRPPTAPTAGTLTHLAATPSAGSVTPTLRAPLTASATPAPPAPTPPSAPHPTAAPTSLADAASRIPTGDARVRVERYAMPDGSRQFAVYVPGTRTQLAGGFDPWDNQSNVELYTGQTSASYAATTAALDAAGARPGDVVHAWGHSQGAMITSQLALSSDYDVRTNVTLGSPIEADVGDGTLSVGIRHIDDPVAALAGGGHATPVGAPGSFVVETTFDAETGLHDARNPAHPLTAYVETAERVDAAGDPRVARVRDVLAELGTATEVDATEFTARRVLNDGR